MEIFQNLRSSFAFIQVFVCAVAISGTASRAAGQVGTGETVIQKATEQFESSPLKTSSLDKGIWMFSGDGGDVTAIVDDGSTLLIDSGLDSRATELADAIFRATLRPVTRLVNTHWHFDHTGGNVYFGSGGVTIIGQENVKQRLSSVQNVPFIGLRDGRYPTQALPTMTYFYISPANVAVVGDIFSNHFYPIIDLASAGSIDGMIHSLDQILAQTDEQTKIVPGHGPVATRSDLQDYRDMLVQVRQRIKALIGAGKTIDEAVAAAPTKDFDAEWGRGYVSPDVFVRMAFTSLIDSSNASR